MQNAKRMKLNKMALISDYLAADASLCIINIGLCQCNCVENDNINVMEEE